MFTLHRYRGVTTNLKTKEIKNEKRHWNFHHLDNVKRKEKL